MFYGSVPAEAQAIMNKIVKTWEVSDVYVGCSGNFTLVRVVIQNFSKTIVVQFVFKVIG